MAFSDEDILEDMVEATSRGAPEQFKLKGFGLFTPADTRREENKAYRRDPTNRLRRRAWWKWRYSTDPEFKAEADRRSARYAKSPKGRAQSRKRRKERYALLSEDLKNMQRAKWRQYQQKSRAARPTNRAVEAFKRKRKSTEAQLLKYLKLYLTFNPDEAKRTHVVALLQLFEC